MPEKQRWVRRLSDGRIFGWTPQQATKEGMAECDAKGTLLAAPPADDAGAAGLPDPFLQAEVDRLTAELRVATQTIEAQTIQMRDLQAENAALREGAQAAVQNPDGGESPFNLEAFIAALPADNADAKLAVDEMAVERYGINLDRRASLPKMIEQVREAEQARQAAA